MKGPLIAGFIGTSVGLLCAGLMSLSLLTGYNNPTVDNPGFIPFGKQYWQPICHFAERSPKDQVTVYRTVSRMKVPNGWLYMTSSETYGIVRDQIIFVPDLFAKETGCITSKETEQQKTNLPK